MTKIRFGFRSSKQLDLFMIWREYHELGEVIHARVLFYIPWPFKEKKYG